MFVHLKNSNLNYVIGVGLAVGLASIGPLIGQNTTAG